jgi:hypothetical protein
MAKNTSRFVLVDEEQIPASPQDVLEYVQQQGFKATAQHFGYSESHLRVFLKRNGVVSRTKVVYEREPITMEEKVEFASGG